MHLVCDTRTIDDVKASHIDDSQAHSFGCLHHIVAILNLLEPVVVQVSQRNLKSEQLQVTAQQR